MEAIELKGVGGVDGTRTRGLRRDSHNVLHSNMFAFIDLPRVPRSGATLWLKLGSKRAFDGILKPWVYDHPGVDVGRRDLGVFVT